MSNTLPILTTERLLLRQLAITDADDLLRLRSDGGVNRYLNRPPATIDSVLAFIQNILDTTNGLKYYWAINLADDPTLIGTICLWNFSADGSVADIGYELSPQHQHKGIMTEALQAVVKYGFEQLKLTTIIGVTVFENADSVSVLTRNGFILDVQHLFLSAEEAGNQVVYFRNAE